MSPHFFVVIMEYLNRALYIMQLDPDFNHHAKYEKLNIVNLSFPELMMSAFNKFTVSTGMRINPSKCHVFFGGVDANTKQDIINLTNFVEGSLPFKYFVVPLTCKKLSIHHYMKLVYKIVIRIRHWSTNLLSMQSCSAYKECGICHCKLLDAMFPYPPSCYA